MSTVFIQQLPPSTQSALHAIGIHNDVQLAEIGEERLIKDLKDYFDFFPKKAQPELLQLAPRLCEKAQEFLTLKRVDFVAPAHAVQAAVGSPFEEGHDDLSSQTDFETAIVKKHTRNIYKQGLTNAIRYRRSFTCYIGAICTCIIVPIILSALLLPVYMLFNKSITVEEAKDYLIAAVILSVLYYVCGGLFRCQVCHINIYSMRKFPRHRHAHHLPLLNTSIPTALTVMTKLWFRCPACGTAQKLFRKKHNRTSKKRS